MDLFYTAPVDNGTSIATIWLYFTAGSYTDFSFSLFLPTAGQTQIDQEAHTVASQATYATAHSYSVTNTQSWYGIIPTLPVAPASYQTIVSQTGTAAPAVSGGFTPANTYAGAPTFTWARTGAGVYTLTASSAVFNTSKTGVFISPLQNLNASVRGVVTSSTVVTITTAVQSVAVLGLLGLTTTNTDVLLSNTMIYIQTYA